MTHDRLKEILTRRLKLKDPEFQLQGRGRISGRLVSPTFTRMRDHQRQQMIWDALDAELGAASAGRQVGMLLAYAPDEWGLQLEGTVARGTVRQAKPKAHRKAG